MSRPSLLANWQRLSFRLPALIVMFAALTGIVGGSIAYYIAREGFIEAAKERVELVRNERARAITTLVNDIRIGLASLVTRPGLARDINDLSSELRKLAPAQREAIVGGYTVNSAFPVGSRSAVHDLGDGSGYSAKHKSVHDRLLTIQQLKQLDDLLLVDLSGEIVYTAAKEPEFGTNLLSGPYRDTGAAEAFRRALAAQPPWEQVFVDMRQYAPTGGPAAFMAQAVRDDDGRLAGVMMFQLNNPKFREVANHVQDLGNTGEVYLVGADATRRSHTRFSEGALNSEKLSNEGAVRSAAGFTATTITRNYRGTQVIAAYAPLDLMGVRWGIVSNIDLDEALAPLNAIAVSTIAGVLLSTLLIAFMGYASARRISRPLDQSLRVMDKLSRGDLHVEIEDGNGILETRQISSALRTFHGNLRETQRLMAEVTKNQEQLGGLLDSSPTGVIVLANDNEVLYANDPATHILGMDKSTFVGGKFSFSDIAMSREQAGRMIAAARRDGVVKQLELKTHVPQKGDVVLNLSIRRTAYLSREAYLIWFHDITEQKQLQSEVETALAVAKEERTRTDAILAGAPDPIIIVRSDSRIEYVNDQVTRVLGYAASELVGQTLEMLIPKRFHMGHKSQVRGFFEAGQVRFMGAGRELFALAKSGKEIPVAIALSPVKAGDRSVVVAAIRDVTEQKQAEMAVREAKELAEAATKAKSDFLAAMSHEIRTPMNGVTGMADLLAQSELSDEQRHMVRTIRESGNALINVINDILDFSKIEAGKMDIESVTMSITDAVEGVASTLTPNASKKSVRIQVFVDPNIPDVVYGDPTRLRQILFNMGGNAVKFSNGKDVHIRAEFAGRADGQHTWLRFSVVDRGIGISKENQAKLFQAFSQAESSTTRRFGGTGLGLAICKRLTEMMNGVIGVDSREGHGSTFYVELPFRTADGAAPHQKPRDLRDLTVLLLGSEGPRSEAIEAYLAHGGAEVVTADTADEAVAALKKSPKIDSIMVDIGLDSVRQEKALAVLRNAVAGKTPIIVLQDYQNRGARIQNTDVVTVDANPLVRYRIISSVAVAAGRASPQVRTEDEAAIIRRAKAPTLSEARATGQLILLAEDNLTNQDVIRRQLGLLGYACDIANNGIEALKAFKAGGYALLLTDCHMPEMDGYELTGSIRALEQGSGARFPIVAVTANALQGEAERCLAAGMDDYITKPIAMPALVTALKKWMPASKDQAPGSQDAGVDAPKAEIARSPSHSVEGERIFIDESAIKDIFGDDPTTFKEIMISFVGPSQDIISDILASLDKRAAGGVKEAAHKLKSSARSIGATALADLCVALENAGKNADWAAIEALAPKARDEFGRVEVYIKKL